VALDQHPFSGKTTTNRFEGKTVHDSLHMLTTDKTIHPAFRALAKTLIKSGFLRDVQDLVVRTHEVGREKDSLAEWHSSGHVYVPADEKMAVKTLFHELPSFFHHKAFKQVCPSI
jgi:hypothetical protein